MFEHRTCKLSQKDCEISSLDDMKSSKELRSPGEQQSLQESTL